MSKLGYARLLLTLPEVPSGALIYVLDRVGNKTRFIHRKSGKIYSAVLGDRSLLWFPAAKDILMLLSEHTPVGILWQRGKDGGWYNVVSMQFGVREATKVPVFGGKKKTTRTVTTISHVKIRARTFDQAAYYLFFATLGGKLCRRNIKGEFEFLYWDSLEQKFKTERRKNE